MREQLIRYLLGELDADERRELHAQLKEDPELQQELARLRACVAAHRDDDLLDPAPPRGLAARTAERVVGGEDSRGLAACREGAAFTRANDHPAGILGWSLADLTVAGGVMLAVSMLIFPALRNSRDGTRRTVCQNNLHELLVLGTLYANKNGRFYPQVGPGEHAGVFVAKLIAAGHVKPEDIGVLLVCPGGAVADAIRSKRLVLHWPSADEIKRMTAGQYAQFTASASPCYSYRLPYKSDGKLCYVGDESQPYSPIFSDSPGDDGSTTVSPNHGPIFQVVFDNGGLKSFTSCTLPGVDNDMFHNDSGEVAAGKRRLDVVLARSSATLGADLEAASQ